MLRMEEDAREEGNESITEQSSSIGPNGDDEDSPLPPEVVDSDYHSGIFRNENENEDDYRYGILHSTEPPNNFHDA
ncbi:Hypothetical protein FKW44_023752 [Caligus rogercresseyi]|uniref:Uncharacterized protein n=1 Tax=Caligus rogercresseyi TaxID=217165 RepID=A0A7T8GQ56_CALRO|nr:Hypothetical protein FKW44_023752 [Caligus rogercresseyi]